MKRSRKSNDNNGHAKRAKAILNKVAARNASAPEEGSVHPRHAKDGPSSREPVGGCQHDIVAATDNEAEVRDNDAGNVEGSQDEGSADMTGDQDVDYSEKLDQAIQATVQDRKNVFITGPAGSGKTSFTRRLVHAMRRLEVRFEKVAPSGTAAVNFGGVTCHSFLGLDANKAAQSLRSVATVGQQNKVKQRLSDLQVLLIDEVSMVSSEFLVRMDAILREARNSDRVFGGLVVVAIGDFSQLGPVKPFEHCVQCGTMRRQVIKDKSYHCASCGNEVKDEDKWAFRSTIWAKLKFTNILLDKIVRQKSPAFQEIVWDMFLGNRLTTSQNAMLLGRTSVTGAATRLFTHRNDATVENDRRYRMLTTPENHFTAVDDCYISPAHEGTNIGKLQGRVPGTQFLTFNTDHRYSQRVKLRTGMPVVLLTNLKVQQGLINGSQGTIVDWHYEELGTSSRSSDDAGTSGYTLDPAEGRVVSRFIPLLSDGHASRRYNRICNFSQTGANAQQPWPVVRFNNGHTAVIFPDCSIREIMHEGEVSLFIRTQVPLLPAWALTIHRAQGLTLDNVIVDLGNSFEPGQEYVAISRARSLEGLEIHNFKNGLRSPQVVRDFLVQCFPKFHDLMR